MSRSMTTQEDAGRGHFQWNRGGWFGGQVGATLWLLLLGATLLAKGHGVGAVALLLGLAANGVGVALWRRRDRMEPYPAIQLMIGACGLAALLAVLAVSLSDPSPEAQEMTPSLPLLLVYPALMALFHLQERAARKRAG